MERVRFLLVVLVLTVMAIGCTSHSSSATQEDMQAMQAMPALSMVAERPKTPEIEEPEVEGPSSSMDSDEAFYAHWHDWCEPLDYEHQCETNADCKDLEADAIGRPLRCVRPWWSRGNKLKLCAPGYATQDERQWRRDRLREIVRQQYFDEVEYCALDGRPIAEEHWRCQKEWKKAEQLTKLLWLVYIRETSARPWKRHRLNPDLSANKHAWVRRAESYGWDIDLKCDNGHKRCSDKHLYVAHQKPMEDKPSNPHYADMYRWQYGLGAFGQNAALWTDTWDKMAPPEILCLEVPAFETYLRRARRVVSILKSGVDCDGDGKKDYWKQQPTFLDVHRGTSGGKVCPATSKNAKKHEQGFRKRAQRVGLNPDEVVSVATFGKPIERANQNDRLAEIYAVLEEKLPHP